MLVLNLRCELDLIILRVYLVAVLAANRSVVVDKPRRAICYQIGIVKLIVIDFEEVKFLSLLVRTQALCWVDVRGWHVRGHRQA